MNTKWTKEQMQRLIEQNDKMVERSLIVLFQRQTPDERRDEQKIGRAHV